MGRFLTLGLIVATWATTARSVSVPVRLDSKEDMQAWHPCGGDWAVTEGCLSQPDARRSENAWADTAHCFLEAPALSDFSVTFEFFVEQAEGGVGAAQFLFRATDSRTYYLIQFSSKASGVFLVREDHTTHWADIKRAYDVPMPRGRWHTVEVRVEGTSITIDVNSKPVLQASDATLAAGLVGFGTSQAATRFRNIVLQGETAAMNTPWTAIDGKFIPPDYRIVCDDAGAGTYEAFPDVCRCRNGDLLCVFYAGYGHVSFPTNDLPRGARVAAVRSSDEGRTWTPAQVVADTPWDDRDPSVACLKDGTLLCNWFTYYGGFREPEGDKNYRYKELWTSTSTDNGHTWSAPLRIPHMAGAYWGCSSPVIELQDGTLLWPVYREYLKPLRNWSAVLRSTDKGTTWSAPHWVDETNDDNDEPCLLQQPDGRILCVMRANKGKSMWYSWSQDGGRTWAKSRTIGFPGHAPYLFRTRNGRLLLGHRLPNTSLNISSDDGNSWGETIQMDMTIGSYPSMVALDDDAILFVYYEEGPGSSIRAQKIRTTPKGVEPVPWGN